MGCGCGCNKPPKGNFTYIRFASDDQGSDFAKTINEGAITRCYQAIIASPIELDTTTIAFQNLFLGKWFDFCGTCSCGCEWAAYNTPDYITGGGENTWTFNTSTSPTYSNDPTVENKVYVVKLTDGSKMAVMNMRHADDTPLTSGTTYCIEFNLVNAGIGFPDDTYVLSLGDGGNATQISLNHLSSLGLQKHTMTAEDGGLFSADELVITTLEATGGGATLEGTLTITDFRIGPADCCTEVDAPLEIPELQVKLKSVEPKNGDYQNWLVETYPEGNYEFMYTDEIWVKWDIPNLKFLEQNPEIWMFRWGTSRVKKTVEGEGDVPDVWNIRKAGWRHTSHQGGSKFTGSNEWGGDNHCYVNNGVDPPSYITLSRDTEWAITDRGVWSKIPFDPHTFFHLGWGMPWDKGTSYPVNGFRGVRGVRGYQTASTGPQNLKLRFAIVINSPDTLNGSVTNPQPKKIIGGLSPDILISPWQRKVTEIGTIVRFKYRLGSTNYIKHS